jgi:hypothetical protein
LSIETVGESKSLEGGAALPKVVLVGTESAFEVLPPEASVARFLNQKTPQMTRVITRIPPTTGTRTNTIKVSVFESSEPPFLVEMASVGEKVGGQVDTSSTAVLEGSTTGAPNATAVEVVIVVEPAATDSSTQRVAVAGSAKEVAT